MENPGPTDLVVGLARHSGTESRSSGASPGTLLLFTTLEHSLRERCQVRLLPPYYYGAPAHLAVLMAEEFLAGVDALVLSVPPHTVDLEALALVRRRLGWRIPFIYLPLGEFPRGAVSYRHLFQYLEPFDVIAFSSAADEGTYAQLVASTPASTVVVPFGIDSQPFRQAGAFRAATRRRLGLTDGDVVVIVHGRCDLAKNLHGATAVFGELLRRVPGCRLWFLGEFPERGPGIPGPHPLSFFAPGPHRDLLIESLAGADPAAVFSWGEVPRSLLPEVLAAADIGLNLSVNTDENFGFSVVEAMAAGLPVVGTDWGGLRDTIDHGVTGYRVETTVTSAGVAVDTFAAVGHLVALATDPLLRSIFGAAGAARVEERFRLDRFADVVVDLVRGALEPERETRGHAWTPTGRRLVDRYSIPLSGARSGNFPLPLPPDLVSTDPGLVRDLTRSYATRVQYDEPLAGATYAFASPLLRHTPGRLRCSDPLLLVDCRPLDSDEDEVCSRLATGPADYENLDADGAALRRLLAAGLVVRSAVSMELSRRR